MSLSGTRQVSRSGNLMLRVRDEQAQRNEALLAVREPVIFESERHPFEHACGIYEVKAMALIFAVRLRVAVLGRPAKFRSTSMRSAALIRDW